MGHRLPRHEGKCFTLHGHRYAAEFTCASSLDEQGRVVDFGVIKEVMGRWIAEKMDHTMTLSSDDPIAGRMCRMHEALGMKPILLMAGDPTAENLAELLYEKAQKFLPDGIFVASVVVYETPNCRATYPFGPRELES
jgi:6-pyruvoyltetrahydropterin/6-carboxytetrahydropterin synthase